MGTLLPKRMFSQCVSELCSSAHLRACAPRNIILGGALGHMVAHVWRGVIDEHIPEHKGPIFPWLAEGECLAWRQLALSRKLLHAEGCISCQAPSGVLGLARCWCIWLEIAGLYYLDIESDYSADATKHMG